jgi:glycine/D-amino acid oxidase-like deaminating enzyme
MDRQFDLVVVGTGVTSAVASRCREAGWSVAVVDRQPFGGTCALRGCVPKRDLGGTPRPLTLDSGAVRLYQRGGRGEAGASAANARLTDVGIPLESV